MLHDDEDSFEGTLIIQAPSHFCQKFGKFVSNLSDYSGYSSLSSIHREKINSQEEYIDWIAMLDSSRSIRASEHQYQLPVLSCGRIWENGDYRQFSGLGVSSFRFGISSIIDITMVQSRHPTKSVANFLKNFHQIIDLSVTRSHQGLTFAKLSHQIPRPFNICHHSNRYILCL